MSKQISMLWSAVIRENFLLLAATYKYGFNQELAKLIPVSLAYSMNGETIWAEKKKRRGHRIKLVTLGCNFAEQIEREYY